MMQRSIQDNTRLTGSIRVKKNICIKGAFNILTSVFMRRNDADHMTFVDQMTVFIEYIVVSNKHCGCQVV